jgi:hypothetical protein
MRLRVPRRPRATHRARPKPKSSDRPRPQGQGTRRVGQPL